MSNHGYDTWILEVRGLGLSTDRGEMKYTEQIRSETLSKQPLVKASTYDSSVRSSISSRDGLLRTLISLTELHFKIYSITSGIKRCKDFSLHF